MSPQCFAVVYTTVLDGSCYKGNLRLCGLLCPQIGLQVDSGDDTESDSEPSYAGDPDAGDSSSESEAEEELLNSTGTCTGSASGAVLSISLTLWPSISLRLPSTLSPRHG